MRRGIERLPRTTWAELSVSSTSVICVIFSSFSPFADWRIKLVATVGVLSLLGALAFYHLAVGARSRSVLRRRKRAADFRRGVQPHTARGNRAHKSPCDHARARGHAWRRAAARPQPIDGSKSMPLSPQRSSSHQRPANKTPWPDRILPA
jgi:hypothetical protein